jgi:hypothetical protein
MITRMRNWMQHRVNPLHVYCRLVDMGLSRKWARWVCGAIEPVLRIAYI